MSATRSNKMVDARSTGTLTSRPRQFLRRPPSTSAVAGRFPLSPVRLLTRCLWQPAIEFETGPQAWLSGAPPPEQSDKPEQTEEAPRQPLVPICGRLCGGVVDSGRVGRGRGDGLLRCDCRRVFHNGDIRIRRRRRGDCVVGGLIGILSGGGGSGPSRPRGGYSQGGAPRF